MTNQQRARALRADGATFVKVAELCSISKSWAYKIAGDVVRGHPRPTEKTVVKPHAMNGGCSSRSGMIGISMPRIVALHGVLA